MGRCTRAMISMVLLTDPMPEPGQGPAHSRCWYDCETTFSPASPRPRVTSQESQQGMISSTPDHLRTALGRLIDQDFPRRKREK